jgi:hypothetical protein
MTADLINIVRSVLQLHRAKLFQMVKKQVEHRDYNEPNLHEWLDRAVTEVSERIAHTPSLNTPQVSEQEQEDVRQAAESLVPEHQTPRRGTPPKRPGAP